MPKAGETLLLPRWMIPVVPRGRVLENHALLIRDGRIADLLPASDARTKYPQAEQVDLGNHLLIPGLINMHGHAAMTLLRGLADDLPLQAWLNDHIWPAEAQWVGAEFVRDGTRLACAEMIRGGTTSFADMYFFPDQVAEVAIQSGMRAQVAFPVLNFPSAWAASGDEYIHRGLELHDQYRDHPTIQIAFGPHAPYTVSDKLMERIVTLAGELDSVIHIHMHETRQEVEDYRQTHGTSPLLRLQQMGIVGPRTQCVHMTCLDDREIELLTSCNAQVIHCPESNLKLANGFCPTDRLLKAGVTLALGTDGAASNNDLDMLGEMRSAAFMGKAVAGNPSACSAAEVLEMATIQAARTLGMEQELGSLEIGKLADLTALDLSASPSQPVYHPLSWLIYAASARDVSHVWVGGKPLLEDGQLTTLDKAAIQTRTRDWAGRIGSTSMGDSAA